MEAEKRPMTKGQYIEQVKPFKKVRERVDADPYRMKYHLQPPMGWLNDPNGLCQIGNEYHIYFQYTPFNPEGGTGLWGHMVTEDFIHYEEKEPAIYPDCSWDANGAYSGSAFETEGEYYFYYTGNVKHSGNEHDYITKGREQNVILTKTRDGNVFSKKQLIMKNSDYPHDMSLHVRDPQVIRKNNKYYMILGARDLSEKGSVLVFQSDDLHNFTYLLRFTTTETFGYMWECPNYVELDGKQFLVVCPQGVASHGLDFANAHQCGYFPLSYKFGEETYQLGDFYQLDRGFDFYAPQIFTDHRNRVIMIGWMGMPDSDYGNEATVQNGWQHALTLPRELYVSERGRLAQRPLEELKQLRNDEKKAEFSQHFSTTVGVRFELNICFETSADFTMKIREGAELKYEQSVLRLRLGACGSGRRERGVAVENIADLKIISDSSCVEIFVNGGEEVFTTRIYDSMQNLWCELHGEDLRGSVRWYSLG